MKKRSSTADEQQHRNMDALKSYYAAGHERDRLSNPRGVIEFERTKEVLLRELPPAPAIIADIGGGPGRYTLWLAELGYHVYHRDIIDLHVTQLQASLSVRPDLTVQTSVGDARFVDLPDESADAVLLLGPLYHLPKRSDRIQALREARRIVKPNGPVFAAAISRWSPRLDAVIGQRLYERSPEAMMKLPDLEHSGWMKPLFPGSFTGFTHRPKQLKSEVVAAGLDVISLVGLEGVNYLLSDLADRVQNPEGLEVLLESARALESVPELLGASAHLLATGIKAE